MSPERSNDTQAMTHVMNVIAEYFRRISPQEKDRLMQLRLAEVRGPVRNVRLVCQMTAMLLKARRINQPREERDVH